MITHRSLKSLLVGLGIIVVMASAVSPLVAESQSRLSLTAFLKGDARTVSIGSLPPLQVPAGDNVFTINVVGEELGTLPATASVGSCPGSRSGTAVTVTPVAAATLYVTVKVNGNTLVSNAFTLLQGTPVTISIC